MSPLPPRNRGMQQIPISPPVSQMARATSSGLPRKWRYRPAQVVWLATIGRADAFAASRLVRQPECATSTITPRRFISAIAWRPKSLRPPSFGSPAPSPSGLRRLYVRCIIRTPS